MTKQFYLINGLQFIVTQKQHMFSGNMLSRTKYPSATLNNLTIYYYTETIKTQLWLQYIVTPKQYICSADV